jgi:threonine dehydrogenase-like Zn-dependent dehydrogenase
MKAIAVKTGKAGSIHLREIRKPSVDDIPEGRGVLVKVLMVGVDGTDREIDAGEYGNPPEGDDYLVIGHESLGVVEDTGGRVAEFRPGDLVAATVRRPGNSIYDLIGTSDMTTDDTYFERGINLLHGYLTEFYVERPEYLVSLPPGLRETGVLIEPTSIAEKGIAQAFEIQQRLKVWRPERAAVLGAGTIGLLATLLLRLRGVAVFTFGRRKPPYRNADLIREIGGSYLSTKEISLTDASKKIGPFDVIFEATGYSPLAFEAMSVLGKNGVFILSSVTGGDPRVEIPADEINLGLVLGNKVVVGTVNANREHFEMAISDLSRAELMWPGWAKKLLTHPVDGLKNYGEMIRLLEETEDAIKVFVKVHEI